MKELLIESANELGIRLNEKMSDNFFMYKDLLLEWNEKINLTAITEEREIILKHFIDSISILTAVEMKKEISIVDIGTGAGFPGIPVKIVYPDCKMTLIDSLNKRVKFLQEVITKLQLQDITAVHGRAEDVGQDKNHREKYDLCLSRAVANLSVLAEFCLPMVKIGGEFISLKGPDATEEISTAKTAINILGGEISDIKKLKIPNSDIVHSIVVIKKIRQVPSKYPRKAGYVTKNPIS